MGMSSSQARLLTLTARLHDVELKAQNVMSQKIALATQKDELYQEYCEALDATALKVAYNNGGVSVKYVDANYETLCNYDPDRKHQLYALRDNRSGYIFTSQEVADNYEDFGNDKYAFAYAMLGFSSNFNFSNNISPDETGKFVGKIGAAQDSVSSTESKKFEYIDEGDGTYSLYMTEAEQIAYNNTDKSAELVELYNKIFEDKGNKVKQQEALDKFRDTLYDELGNEIFEIMNLNKNDYQEYVEENSEKDFPDLYWADIKEEFNYYVNLWTAINEAGGCKVIEPQYEDGEAGTTWFQNMVEAGRITIMAYSMNGHKNEWSDTSFATSTNQNYLQEVQDDTALKKAEAEYEHELGVLNRKDTGYDTELSKLETERTSITTEMESITKVRDENVERTFGIFS